MTESIEQAAQGVGAEIKTVAEKVEALADKAEVPAESLWHHLEAKLHDFLDSLLQRAENHAPAVQAEVQASVPPAGAPTVGIVAK